MHASVKHMRTAAHRTNGTTETTKKIEIYCVWRINEMEIQNIC